MLIPFFSDFSHPPFMKINKEFTLKVLVPSTMSLIFCCLLLVWKCISGDVELYDPHVLSSTISDFPIRFFGDIKGYFPQRDPFEIMAYSDVDDNPIPPADDREENKEKIPPAEEPPNIDDKERVQENSKMGFPMKFY